MAPQRCRLFSGRKVPVPVVQVCPSMSSGPRPLTSWKEIAHYLGVNVRTAQKWERERGLPVRRSDGARSRVNADEAALDTWKSQLAAGVRGPDRCYSWP